MGRSRYADTLEFYSTANEEALKANYRRAGLPESMLNDLDTDRVASVKAAKADAEKYLADRNQLHTNLTEILDCFLSGTPSLYVSLHIDAPKYSYLSRWDPYGMHIRYRYGIEKVFVQFWFTRFYSSVLFKLNLRKLLTPKDAREYSDREFHICQESIRSFDFFGRMVWDAEHKRIDAIPLYLTNITVDSYRKKT